MHLGHFFKKIGRMGESVFGLARQSNGGGSGGDPSVAAAANTTPMGGDAQSNAGDAVVNYQTKGKPGLQQLGQRPQGS